MRFTKKEDRFLKNNYMTMPANRMSKILGRSESGARQRMQVLGIVVPQEVTEKFRMESRFPKGHVSYNKGKKQKDYMTKAAIAKTKATRFKKGQIPHNAIGFKNGDITIRTDKRGVKYKFTRISLGKWIPLHRKNWQAVNGKIPFGMKVIFKDGNTMNCHIKNLKLVTPGQLMKLNSYHNYPKPIAQVIQLSGALTRQINKHQKKLANEK